MLPATAVATTALTTFVIATTALAIWIGVKREACLSACDLWVQPRYGGC
jgi:hypothetical protein